MIGPNYMTWRKLNLVLIAEDVEWVIETLMSVLLSANWSYREQNVELDK